jgi:hypothetical protein
VTGVGNDAGHRLQALGGSGAGAGHDHGGSAVRDDEELAAVTVPSLLNAAFSVGILARSQAPGVSSTFTTVSPLRTIKMVVARQRLDSSCVMTRSLAILSLM